MKDNPSDKVYTPDFIVDEVLAIFGENILDDEVKLEPHRGTGAFYDKDRCFNAKEKRKGDIK